MWYSILFLLACIVWTGYGNSICEESITDVCKIPEELSPLRFPDSAKKLEKICSKIVPYSECAADYQEHCSTLEFMSLKKIQSQLNTIKAICETNSTWFNGVVKYGHCYENLKQNVPSDFARNCSEKIRENPKLAYLNDPNNDPELNGCYRTIGVASCATKKISEECGEHAKELVLHFIRLAGPWNFICLDYQKKAMKLMKDLDFTFDPKTSEEEFAALLAN